MDAPAPEPTTEPPDPRYVLANERTFLAWLRSSLALLAGGVALARLEPTGNEDRTLVVAVSAGCVGLAVVFAIGAYVRWMKVRDAIERGVDLPVSFLVPVMAVGVFALAAGGLILVFR